MGLEAYMIQLEISSLCGDELFNILHSRFDVSRNKSKYDSLHSSDYSIDICGVSAIQIQVLNSGGRMQIFARFGICCPEKVVSVYIDLCCFIVDKGAVYRLNYLNGERSVEKFRQSLREDIEIQRAAWIETVGSDRQIMISPEEVWQEFAA